MTHFVTLGIGPGKSVVARFDEDADTVETALRRLLTDDTPDAEDWHDRVDEILAEFDVTLIE